MGKSKRYRKSNKNEEDEQRQEEKRLKLLEQKKSNLQIDYSFEANEKQERKTEKNRLRNMIKEFNHGQDRQD